MGVGVGYSVQMSIQGFASDIWVGFSLILAYGLQTRIYFGRFEQFLYFV